MFQHTGRHLKHRPTCCPDLEGVTPPSQINSDATALKGGVSISKESLMKHFGWQQRILDGLCVWALLGVLLLSGCATLPQRFTQAHTLWQSPPIELPAQMPLAERIAHIAQREHQAWYAPFINQEGRLLNYRMAEAEAKRLQDGSPAWERVLAYWRESGALALLPFHHYSQQCLPTTHTYQRPICRLFTIDTAWSAAFVSYVMVQAEVPTFRVSPRHFDYMRAAWQQQGVYRLHDPAQTALTQGDMLCYVRGRDAIQGYRGLVEYFAQHDEWLPAHCDIVVATQPNEVWLVGGNVANTVALRKLPLDKQGRAVLPAVSAPSCSLNNEIACNMNRQNWVAVLKLIV